MVKADSWLRKVEKEIEMAKKEGKISQKVLELVSELRIHQTELEMQNEELKLSQEELFTLYEQYYELYDGVPIGYFTLDENGIIKNVNVKGAELLQLKKSLIIGRGFNQFIQKDSENNYYRSLKNAGDTGENQKIELKLRGKELFYGHMEIMPSLNRERENYRLILTDITKRQKPEDKILEREKNFRALAENAGEAMLIGTGKGSHVYANPKAAEITGYTIEELLKTSIKDLAHPDDINELIERYKARLDGETLSVTHETRIIRKDNKTIPIELKASKIIWDGQPADMVLFHDISHQIKARKELQRANLYNRKLIEASLDSMVTIGPDGKITDVNKATLNITGCLRDELIGADFSNYFTEPEKARGGYQQVFKEGFVRDYPLEIKNKNGHIVPVLYNATVYKGEFGDIVGVFAAARDITDIKQFEGIMQARSRLLEFTNSHSMNELLTATLDEIEALTGSNIGFYHFLQGDQKTLSLQNWSTNTLKNMCTAEGKGSHYDIDQAGVWVDCIYKRRPVIHNNYSSLSHRKGLPEGHSPVNRELIVPIFRDKVITAIIGVGNKSTDYDENDVEIALQLGDLSWDIVERKQAEEKLKEAHATLELKVKKRTEELEKAYKSLSESEAQLKIAMDLAKLVSWQYDVESDMFTFDDHFYALYGTTAEKEGGVQMSSEEYAKKFILSEESYLVAEAIAKATKTDNPNLVENIKHSIVRADGEKRDLIVRFGVIKDDKGRTIKTYGANQDITEQEKAKKELENLINELKRSNEELKQFAYVSSHDLQEPLRTIASFTQLLERRYKNKLDEDADEFLDYIVEAAIRMKQQIQDLLEYSRVVTKGEDFELVDMNSVINQTITVLNASIEESKAEIIIEKLPHVIGDAVQLRRVFQNLISNAIKFRKDEEPLKIRIFAYKSEDGKEYVINIKDNGIGIEEQYFERIFTIFQRLHTRDVYDGTGIGLSIVKRIIERHGGHVWVESEYNKGSTFYFTMPFIEE